jgi:hypothetical protein
MASQWIFYIVVHSIASGSMSNVEVKRFDGFNDCEKYLHTQYRATKKTFTEDGKRYVSGGGCRKEQLNVRKQFSK